MTTAPAQAELPKSYVPSVHEEEIRRRWEDSGVFHGEPPADDGAPAYCILIPPPNVTAALHLGHAFNITAQDVLIRYHRMRGENTLWMPGTDHAGIATQAVVEKRLLAEGRHRRDMGRDAFVEKVQAWKEEFEATITDQLKAIGASCDWARQRFTMDEVCTRAVREAFFRLFRDELIYRGKRLVNWDPVTLTALADDEVEMTEIAGHFWYMKYPVVDADGRDTGAFVTVATTRPETMLGDTAVAVNPRDAERVKLVGQTVRLPIVDRLIPVIADDYVVLPDAESDDPKARYASGFLKVTPAHDPNDWEIGQRHGLAIVNVMAPDASISRDHGWDDVSAEAEALLGLSREDAREAIVSWFRDHDLLADVRDYAHSVGHSYRSHVPIEPYLSDQWYVRVSDDRLVGEAQRALAPEQFEGAPPAPADPARGGRGTHGDGEIEFFPARYARSYQSWHESLRDWCISRQLWWGHRIPVWSLDLDDMDDAEREQAWQRWRAFADERPGAVAIARSTETTARLNVCLREDDRSIIESLEQAGFNRDPDVLDTWFSSALWPLSTMGWPAPSADDDTIGLLETFNPSSVLVTAREIITLWVSRMVMFNRYFNGGTVPFAHVYIHAMIQDGHGQKMSKSLGNGVDPRDCIHSHGVDALRFTMVQMATNTQDVRMPVDMVCPHCDENFHPKESTTAAGHHVAAPEQTCPKCGKSMISGYGAASGAATPTDERPVARNTSSKLDLGRNFANKLWNATRFALGSLSGGAPASVDLPLDDLGLADRWIVNRLHATLHQAEDALATYQFSVYGDAVYDLVWRDFCDWYLEAVKPTIRGDAAQQQVLRTVLNAMLRLVHPICPFVTEALWPSVQAAGPAGLDGIVLPAAEPLAGAAWPSVACRVHDDDADTRFPRIQSLTNAIRNIRGERRVPPKKRIALHVTPPVLALIEAGAGAVETLAGLETVSLRSGERASDAIPLAFDGEELLVSGLVDAVDNETERLRLAKVIEEKQKAVNSYRNKLANRGYVDNAPATVVQQTRDRLSEAEADLAAAQGAQAALG